MSKLHMDTNRCRAINILNQFNPANCLELSGNNGNASIIKAALIGLLILDTFYQIMQHEQYAKKIISPTGSFNISQNCSNNYSFK